MAHIYSPPEVERLAREQLPCKYTDVQAKYRAYEQAVYKELMHGYIIANMQQIEQGVLPFSVNRMTLKLKRCGKGGKHKWWTWLHKNFPLVIEQKKGNNLQGTLTMVSLHSNIDVHKIQRMDTQSVIEAVYPYTDPQSIDSKHWVRIDLKSLREYIRQTRDKTDLHPTVAFNLKQARVMFQIAEHFGGWLPQEPSASVFGRTYYKGLNLQSCHKTLRQAALGNSYEVDIRSAVFSWKLSMMEEEARKYTYTREYLDNKKRCHAIIAHAVWGVDKPTQSQEKTLKQVMTSIGFGAKLGTNAWFLNNGAWQQSSLSTMIKSSIDRKSLVECEWVKKFLAEQKAINKHLLGVIKPYYKTFSQELQNELRTASGKSMSDNKLISYVYQQFETQVMDAAIQEKGDAELLLRVHDAAYFKSKPDVRSMQTILQDHWPQSSFGLEHHTSWASVSDSEDPPIDLEHKQRLNTEQDLARKVAQALSERVTNQYDWDEHTSAP